MRTRSPNKTDPAKAEFEIRWPNVVRIERVFQPTLTLDWSKVPPLELDAAQTAQVAELIALAKDMREANTRGEKLGLTEDELAFYDALETNDSAVQVLGDETLRTIARELVNTVRANATIDWILRENVRAKVG